MIKKTYLKIIPLILFLSIAVILWKGLSLHPTEIPSPLINKPTPNFELTTLYYPQKLTTQRDFLGRVTLLNVWASWCYACAEEHSLLLELAKKEYLTLYGLNYKDDPVAAKNWLEEKGNPFQTIAVDPNGNIAIDWGVYGTPESFIIDKKGFIRYKHIGPITQEVWEQKLEPLIEILRNETA